MRACSTTMLNATGIITAINGEQAQLKLVPITNNQQCQQCQQQKGCRSLSLYAYLFAHRPISTINQHYEHGQHVDIRMPKHVITLTIGCLMGLPLLGFITGVLTTFISHELIGFILGIILATAGYYVGKHTITSQIKKHLTIRPINQPA